MDMVLTRKVTIISTIFSLVIVSIGISIILLLSTTPKQRQDSRKITTWLGYTYDIDNSIYEYKGNMQKILSSSDWIIPKNPYIIKTGELEKNELVDNKNWDNYPKAIEILNKSNLTLMQREYFLENNYVPRAVESFDVTGDGKNETIVTSLTLGCGTCVDFYSTVFTDKGKFNATTSEGTLIKTKDGNGFYLLSRYGTPGSALIKISKYQWENSRFVEKAMKEIVIQSVANTN